jgi:maltooligosyltrehalose trehalohydrolase
MGVNVDLSVWAPRAQRVDVIVGDERRPLEAGEAGWWGGVKVETGTDYAFSLDGGPARPDPRSRWQPHGVHGPSRAFEVAALPRRGEDFRAPPLGAALIYELHVGTFAADGTFDGVIERLDHLERLGVTHVELMPVNGFPGARGWGYDGVALWAPHAAYGGPEGLVRLIDACHERGLAVLLDVVYNHLGPDGNYLGELGPYFSERHKTPWGAAVNLDGAGADEARRFFIDNALYWLRDYRFDGLRLDAVHAMVDQSALHFLEQLAHEVAALEAASGRPLVLIAESDLNDPRLVRSWEAGGFGLHAQWSDDFHHALHVALTGEQSGYYEDFSTGLADVARALQRGYVYAGQRSPHRGRVHGRPLGHAVPPTRLLGYVQTHDQVGNRACGDRLAHLVGAPLAQVGAALVLMAPFVPMLFQGEEWAASAPFQYFTDHESPELAEAVRKGRRSEFVAFGWREEDVPDPQDPATFERSRLDFAEIARAPHAETFAWYREIIALRAREPALRDARWDLQVEHGERWIQVTRGPVTLVANVGNAAMERPRPPGRRVVANGEVVESGERIVVPAACAVFYSQSRR